MPSILSRRAHSFGRLALLSTLLTTPVTFADYGSYGDSRNSTVAREEACSFIGELCIQALVAFARNPSLLERLGEIALEAQDKFLNLRLNRCDRHHVAAAIGQIAGAHMVATARNPSLETQFGIVVNFCEDALDGALRGRMGGVDIEDLIEKLKESQQTQTNL